MVTKCTTQFTLTTVHFAHAPYSCVGSLLTVSRNYISVLLQTVQYGMCEERPASTTDYNFSRIFTEQCLSRLVNRLSIRRPEFQHRTVHVRFVVYKMALGQVFPPSKSAFLCKHQSPNTLFSSSYTGCPRRKGPNFGRVFLRSNYTDITQNTYIQSSMVTEILNIEK